MKPNEMFTVTASRDEHVYHLCADVESLIRKLGGQTIDTEIEAMIRSTPAGDRWFGILDETMEAVLEKVVAIADAVVSPNMGEIVFAALQRASIPMEC